MSFEFRFPDVGEGITEGRVVKWKVKVGDTIKVDQVLGEIETDKAVVEIPSPKAGTILKLNAQEGQSINVGDVIVTIGESGERSPIAERVKEVVKAAVNAEIKMPKKKKDAGAVVGQLEEAPEDKPTPKPVPGMPQAVIPDHHKVDDSSVKALPKVRQLAKAMGINLTQVKGSGPDGRVTENDLKGHVGHPPSEIAEPTLTAPKVNFNKYGRFIEIPVTGVRRKIAENMTRSAFTAPHAVEMEEADVTELVKIREVQKKKADNLSVHLTYIPFIVKAVIAALIKHPYVNSTLDMEKGIIINKQYYNIGIAVDTPHGLMVPVLKHADQKSILSLAHDIEMLSEQARTRKIKLDDMQGGTFTITNYGSLGGTFGVPIINYPEAAILGVGRIQDKPVVRDGKIVIRKMLPLSLAFDHRIIDGAQAARFIRSVMNHLEDPDFLLIDMS
ncbi:MAG: dihydrolipoamide acetyltransferase family protein [Candidatus Aenigmatarchaeota archaeon]